LPTGWPPINSPIVDHLCTVHTARARCAGSFAAMRIGSLLPALLLAPAMLQAQTALQRLNNDTMPNRVPNPGFEQVLKVPCAWTQEAAKFNGEVMVAWDLAHGDHAGPFLHRGRPQVLDQPRETHRRQGRAACGQEHGGHQALGQGQHAHLVA
jgi:hypothetical protein